MSKLFAFLLLLFCASPAHAYYFASGTFTGNGTGQSIDISDTTTPSIADFQPDVVAIKCDQANYGYWATSDSVTTSYRFSGSITSTTAITAVSSTGFTVGSDAAVNASSTTCWYVAIGDDGNDDLAVGHYVSDTGSCADDCDVTISPAFQPELVVLAGSGSVSQWRSSAQAGDLSCVFNTGSCSNNRIQALNADGFQYGGSSNVNSDATTYHYWAIKAVSGSTYTNSFTGNTSDDRSITDPNFQPEFIWVKGNSGTDNACARFKDNSGDESESLAADAGATTNQIQAFEATGFQVGTGSCANEDGVTMYYYAMKALPAATSDNKRVIISD